MTCSGGRSRRATTGTRHPRSACPWCGRAIADRRSSVEPLKAPKGFRYDRRCEWRCGGGVMYPMAFCPWCGRPQKWKYTRFDNLCPHCNKGVDDRMDVCPWCGEDATGRDLVRRSFRNWFRPAYPHVYASFHLVRDARR